LFSLTVDAAESIQNGSLLANCHETQSALNDRNVVERISVAEINKVTLKTRSLAVFGIDSSNDINRTTTTTNKQTKEPTTQRR
jgi:hypothetical protein